MQATHHDTHTSPCWQRHDARKLLFTWRNFIVMLRPITVRCVQLHGRGWVTRQLVNVTVWQTICSLPAYDEREDGIGLNLK